MRTAAAVVAALAGGAAPADPAQVPVDLGAVLDAPTSVEGIYESNGDVTNLDVTNLEQEDVEQMNSAPDRDASEGTPASAGMLDT
jgi:hypothetical protein